MKLGQRQEYICTIMKNDSPFCLHLSAHEGLHLSAGRQRRHEEGDHEKRCCLHKSQQSPVFSFALYSFFFFLVYILISFLYKIPYKLTFYFRSINHFKKYNSHGQMSSKLLCCCQCFDSLVSFKKKSTLSRL